MWCQSQLGQSEFDNALSSSRGKTRDRRGALADLDLVRIPYTKCVLCQWSQDSIANPLAEAHAMKLREQMLTVRGSRFDFVK